MGDRLHMVIQPTNVEKTKAEQKVQPTTEVVYYAYVTFFGKWIYSRFFENSSSWDGCVLFQGKLGWMYVGLWFIYIGVSIVMEVPQARWLVYFMENPNRKWMMTGGTSILGNLHIYFIWHIATSTRITNPFRWITHSNWRCSIVMRHCVTFLLGCFVVPASMVIYYLNNGYNML